MACLPFPSLPFPATIIVDVRPCRVALPSRRSQAACLALCRQLGAYLTDAPPAVYLLAVRPVPLPGPTAAAAPRSVCRASEPAAAPAAPGTGQPAACTFPGAACWAAGVGASTQQHCREGTGRCGWGWGHPYGGAAGRPRRRVVALRAFGRAWALAGRDSPNNGEAHAWAADWFRPCV